MRLLHYVEIENFKSFRRSQRIDLDHPSVLIGPNNCGKTSAIQAIALWSQAVKTWYDARKSSSAKERTATGINRLSITAVPVQKTRYFWSQARVHTGQHYIPITITVGLMWQGVLMPVCMRFRHRGDEIVYCSPSEECAGNLELLAYAARLNVELLYPMSGLTTEEPILKAGRINVLLGQGETAQVLRNLCLMVRRDVPEDWRRLTALMQRLFAVELGEPTETTRGSIELHYTQSGIKEPLDLAVAGRGFQQLLLIFAYLYSHKRSILLIDEPDAHLEILRQKQVYVLLRDIATENGSQVILVTHSEVILDEALDCNLTLLLGGETDNLAQRTEIRNTLKHYGTEHYVKARERGYVLYVEGSTDIDILRALAEKIGHPVAQEWDERINAYYVQDNFPNRSLESELERVEGGFGVTPKVHYFCLRNLISGLRGVAILDNDGANRSDFSDGGLSISYWRRYEAENYFITPEVLAEYAVSSYGDMPLFGSYRTDIQSVLDDVTKDSIFSGSSTDFSVYRSAATEVARLLWISKTERIKLSHFAEKFFEELAKRIGQPVLLRKGEFHRLIRFVDPSSIHSEVAEKLDLLRPLFARNSMVQPNE